MVSMSSGLHKFTVLDRSIQKCYLPFYQYISDLGTHQQHLGLTHGSFLLERFRIPQVVLLVGFEGLYVMLEIVPDSPICRASALSAILFLPPFSSAHFLVKVSRVQKYIPHLFVPKQPHSILIYSHAHSILIYSHATSYRELLVKPSTVTYTESEQPADQVNSHPTSNTQYFITQATGQLMVLVLETASTKVSL